MEEESLLRAAQRHTQGRRGSLQLVRKLVAAEGILPRESLLLLRVFHREWRQRCDRPMSAVISNLPTRGGTIVEIITLQAKLTEELDAEHAASVLTRWAVLIDLCGFKPGRVFERYVDRLLFRNWRSLIEAHSKGGDFRTLLEGLVNEGLSTAVLFDDSLLRFAIEIGIIEAESLESQTARFLAGLRAKSEDEPQAGENEPDSTSAAKRHLFDRAVEFNEWEAWTEAWSQLSDSEKRAYAREAFPGDGIRNGGMLESMLVGFLASESCVEPSDLVGVFRTRPWDTVFFGIGDVAACHMDLAARWGAAGKQLPQGAFRDSTYSNGDAAAWPIFISLVHAVASSAVEDAKIALELLITDHPLVLPGLLSGMMERLGDNHPLRAAATALLKEFRLDLARASARAACNLDRLRCLLHPTNFDKGRMVSLIFQLCVDGDAETCLAVQRHADNPLYGEIAIAAMRARAL